MIYMEHLNNKTQHLGVMLRAGGLAAVVSQKNTEDATMIYIECPFPCLKFGYVDILDKDLKSDGIGHVSSYEADADLGIIVLDTAGSDFGRVACAAERSLMKTWLDTYNRISSDLVTSIKVFLNVTQEHWVSIDEFRP